jgi:HK97 family phage major capsid protein
MNKLELFNKLKSEGKIPDGLTVDTVTEKYLLDLDLAVSETKPTATLSMEEMTEQVNKLFNDKVKESGLDKIDLKYAKLPNAELSEDESKDLSADEIKRLKMRKFVKHLFISGDTYTVTPGNTLALNSEASGAVGQYAVPIEFISEVSRLLNLYGVYRRNATYRTFNSQTATMPSLASQPSGAYRTDGSTAFGESNPTFGQVTYTAHDYGFITGITKNLLDDSGVDLVALLSELVANDFARNEDATGFLGTSTGATITGVYPSITSSSYIVTTSSTNANTLTLANLLSLITMPKSKALVGSPKWYFHKTILSLILNLNDTAGRPIFTNQDQMGIIGSRSLLGYPYELADALNINQDSASKPIVLFGDLKMGASIAERQGIDLAMSDSATVGSNSAFEKKLVFFRADTRNDFQCEQPTALAKIVTHA